MAVTFIVVLLPLFVSSVIAGSCKAGHSCKLESLGCYKDKFRRAMPEELLNERDTSSAVFSGTTVDWYHYEKYIGEFACRCAKTTAAKGYTVFGLQFYGECWSGPNAHKTFNKYGPSEECIDGLFRPYSPDDTCRRQVGRSWTNHVYRIGVQGCSQYDIEPIGCYQDDLKHPRPLPNYILNERDYSNENWNGKLIDWMKWKSYSPGLICRCAEAASRKGDDYFAIQFWGECWSGNLTNSQYNRTGVSSRCVNDDFEACPCNGYDCVGKAYTNYVYKLRTPLPCTKNEKRGLLQ